MLEVGLHLVGPAVEELVLVDRSVGRPLARRAVVGAVEDDRVVELAGLLEVVDDPPDLVVGVLREAGEDLGHACEQPLLVVGERVPRAHVVQRAVGALGQRVDRREVGALGQHALLDHARQRPLAVGLVAVVELALVLVGPLRRSVVGRVVGARAEPHEPRPRRRGGLAVADHLQRLVGEVLGQVVALVGRVRLVDRVVVLDQRRIPLVGLAADEAVEAIEALLQRPVELGTARVGLLLGHAVVLADPVGVPAVVAQDARDGPALLGQVRVGARVAGRALDDAGHAVLVVVAPGEHARARRRAQRRGVPLAVAQAVCRRGARAWASGCARRTAPRPPCRCRRRGR